MTQLPTTLSTNILKNELENGISRYSNYNILYDIHPLFPSYIENKAVVEQQLYKNIVLEYFLIVYKFSVHF